MLEKPRIVEERRVCLRVRDRPEMIRGLTYIIEVCEKRYLSQIDSVCEEHSASTFRKIIRSYGLSKKCKPTDDRSYVPNDKNLLFQFWVRSKNMIEAHFPVIVAISPSIFFT